MWLRKYKDISWDKGSQSGDHTADARYKGQRTIVPRKTFWRHGLDFTEEAIFNSGRSHRTSTLMRSGTSFVRLAVSVPAVPVKETSSWGPFTRVWTVRLTWSIDASVDTCRIVTSRPDSEPQPHMFACRA